MWLKHTSLVERRTLTATFAGYGVDGFDYMIYTFIIPTLLAAWGMSKAQAGYIATGALLTSAVGGWAAGVLADRFGRVRVLQWTVLWFAVFTFLSGFTDSFGQLFFTRAMQGFGMGGEWAVGSVLISETISAKHRGKAAGLVQSSWAVGWAVSAICFWVSVNTFCWSPSSCWTFCHRGSSAGALPFKTRCVLCRGASLVRGRNWAFLAASVSAPLV